MKATSRRRLRTPTTAVTMRRDSRARTSRPRLLVRTSSPRLVASGNVSRVGPAEVELTDGVPTGVIRNGIVAPPRRAEAPPGALANRSACPLVVRPLSPRQEIASDVRPRRPEGTGHSSTAATVVPRNGRLARHDPGGGQLGSDRSGRAGGCRRVHLCGSRSLKVFPCDAFVGASTATCQLPPRIQATERRGWASRVCRVSMCWTQVSQS
ncbi:MAG: hypothetical protein QOH50_4430 [Kribbellaceae bacterium]|jgi:hypothetical protein|nr:hypothetical protein [Kribbellaceae bacterium]